VATIVFAMLPQMGHIGPTLPISVSLRAAGHRIVYLAPQALHSEIETSGIECFSGDLAMDTYDSSRARRSQIAVGLSAVTKEVKADLIVIDKVLVEQLQEIDSLPPIRRLIFCTSLLDWEEPSTIPEDEEIVILCPELLEHPKFRYPRNNLFYAEPAIAPQSRDDDREPSDQKPLVLCTFGTQSVRHAHLAEHYQLAFSLAERYPRCDFILAAAYPSLLPDGPWPENLRVHDWVAQQSLLSRASAFVTHGGLGGVKEAILAGVPMIVVPSFGDQFFNAMRVRYHGIGDGLLERRQTAADASQVLTSILSGLFKEKASSMQKRFVARSRSRLSLLFIQEALEGLGSAATRG
jgi:UDP:flavonoid glycosyltransferase YjiC (YdhE family)